MRELLLTNLLSDALSGHNPRTDLLQDPEELHALLILALHHSVLSILAPSLKDRPLSAEDRALLNDAAKQTAGEFYQLFFQLKSALSALQAAKVPVVLLKGVSIAHLYPVPEARRSADIDLLPADERQLPAAEKALLAMGCRIVEQDYNINHHGILATPDNHVIELHKTVTEPFDNAALNHFIEKRFHLVPEDLRQIRFFNTDVPVLRDGLQALHLLLHMYMDFTRTGFGLKLLCDWTVFWNRKVSAAEISGFLSDCASCGLEGFLSVVTTSCIRFLGLRTDDTAALTLNGEELCYENGRFCNAAPEALCLEFLQDVIDTEREGKPSADRMVAMQDTGFFALVKEFHHQTVLNYPRASKTIVALPVLYLIVFVRFLKNNRRVRNGQSVVGILKKSDQRSRLLKKIL